MEIKINPNQEETKSILEKIKANNGYCICSLVKNAETRCMCKDFLEQQQDGWCHCGLYYKKI